MSAKLEGYQTITGNIQRQISTYSECRVVRRKQLQHDWRHRKEEEWIGGDTKSWETEWDVCLLDVFIIHFVPTIFSQDFLQGKLGMWLNCINILRSFKLVKEKTSSGKKNKMFLFWFSISARMMEGGRTQKAFKAFRFEVQTMKQRKRKSVGL